MSSASRSQCAYSGRSCLGSHNQNPSDVATSSENYKPELMSSSGGIEQPFLFRAPPDSTHAWQHSCPRAPSSSVSRPPWHCEQQQHLRWQNCIRALMPQGKRASGLRRRMRLQMAEKGAHACLEGRGWREHVAVDIAARAERGAHVLDDAAEHRLEVLLQHAVQLVRLPRRQPQRAVAKLGGRTCTPPSDFMHVASTKQVPLWP